MANYNKFMRLAASKIISRYLGVANRGPRSHSLQLKENPITKPKYNLPCFPVQSLDQTLSKFFKSAEPFVNQCEMDEIQQLAAELFAPAGRELQDLLLQESKARCRWFTNYCMRYKYLRNRLPLTGYSSPSIMLHENEPFTDMEDYISFAAKLIETLVQVKNRIDKGLIPVEQLCNHKLDNSQLNNVFGTCRIPRPKEDSWVSNPKSNHVIVMHKNHFHVLPVYNKNLTPVPATVIARELEYIVASSHEIGPPVGILTTDHRDNWCQGYELLASHSNNLANIDTIQKALFILALDDIQPRDPDMADVSMCNELLHGGGPSRQGGNRWMDKTLQVIINPNGLCGLTFEHSAIDKSVMMQVANIVVKQLYERVWLENHIPTFGCSVFSEKLNWTLNSEILEKIRKSEENLFHLSKDLNITVLNFDHFGKEFCKEFNLNHDSFTQLALQTAYIKHHNEAPAHSESTDLRIFNGGRSEVVRCCTNASVAFAKSLLNPNVSNTKRIGLLRDAVDEHEIAKSDAQLGFGIDNHLLGLQLMAKEHSIELPEFFKSYGYLLSSNFQLNTAEIGSENRSYMVFGPPKPYGYAVCFNPHCSYICFALTSWKNGNNCEIEAFAKSLEYVLKKMHDIVMFSNTNSNCQPLQIPL